MTEDLHRAADQALARGDIEGALALLEEYVAHDPADFGAWIKLATLRRRTGALDFALEAVNTALDLRANEFLALLLKGSLLEALTDAGRAAEIYQAALFHAPDEARLTAPVKAQLAHARQVLADHRQAVAAAMHPRCNLDANHRARCDRFIENVLDRRPMFHQQPTHYRYPGLPDVEFLDFANAALLDRLRAAFPAIRAEFKALFAACPERQQPYVDFVAGQPVGQWRALNRSPDWNALHLIRYGEPDAVNAALCPQTLAAFAGPEQPHIAGLAPNLMFSLLAPHTRIPPHHGVANFRAVVHLPLVVPSGCGFRVGGETRSWREGEPWIFDDTIEHEAWNESADLRVILIGDVWRPELDPEDREIVRAFVDAQARPVGLGGL